MLKKIIIRCERNSFIHPRNEKKGSLNCVERSRLNFDSGNHQAYTDDTSCFSITRKVFSFLSMAFYMFVTFLMYAKRCSCLNFIVEWQRGRGKKLIKTQAEVIEIQFMVILWSPKELIKYVWILNRQEEIECRLIEMLISRTGWCHCWDYLKMFERITICYRLFVIDLLDDWFGILNKSRALIECGELWGMADFSKWMVLMERRRRRQQRQLTSMSIFSICFRETIMGARVSEWFIMHTYRITHFTLHICAIRETISA